MLREPRQHHVAFPSLPEGTRQRGQHAVEDRGVGLLGSEPEIAGSVPPARFDERERVVGRRCRLGVGQRGQHHVVNALEPDDTAAPRRSRRRAGEDDHAHASAPVHPVRRRLVQREAHVGVASLLDDDHAAVRLGGGRGRDAALDERLGLDHRVTACVRLTISSPETHRPDSARAFRMRTPLTSTDGQPWDTGATWPGWPLPQLNAPPSTQVDSPPTASMAPQKSVVVA